MLTMAYCRVSTEDQADEGYSMEGQADKLRSYAALRELGEVTVVEDPGFSGKNLKRPGLERLLGAVNAGHVAHVLVWRLDRLSRNLGDLIMLADAFGAQGVALHSVQENLDLSSAAGRMFYNILGTFAQFFREQLAENVKMGNERAVREGKWINRPKTGYDLRDGLLVPNDDAERVKEIFRFVLRTTATGTSRPCVGIKYSTVSADSSHSRVYLGEVLHRGPLVPRLHEALVTAGQWAAANRGFVRRAPAWPGPAFGASALRVVQAANAGRPERRGPSALPLPAPGTRAVLSRRGPTSGLVRAAVLGLALIGRDERLQAAIRRCLAGGRPASPSAEDGRRPRRNPGGAVGGAVAASAEVARPLLRGRHKQGALRRGGARLSAEIEAVRAQAGEQERQESLRSELVVRFEQVAALLRDLDIEAVWGAANDGERRILIEELIDSVTVFPDHLEVRVGGAPPLNVLYSEVGLKESENVRVGGGT